jgi:hypothetical protein
VPDLCQFGTDFSAQTSPESVRSQCLTASITGNCDSSASCAAWVPVRLLISGSKVRVLRGALPLLRQGFFVRPPNHTRNHCASKPLDSWVFCFPSPRRRRRVGAGWARLCAVVLPDVLPPPQRPPRGRNGRRGPANGAAPRTWGSDPRPPAALRLDPSPPGRVPRD